MYRLSDDMQMLSKQLAYHYHLIVYTQLMIDYQVLKIWAQACEADGSPRLFYRSQHVCLIGKLPKKISHEVYQKKNHKRKILPVRSSCTKLAGVILLSILYFSTIVKKSLYRTQQKIEPFKKCCLKTHLKKFPSVQLNFGITFSMYRESKCLQLQVQVNIDSRTTLLVFFRKVNEQPELDSFFVNNFHGFPKKTTV